MKEPDFVVRSQNKSAEGKAESKHKTEYSIA